MPVPKLTVGCVSMLITLEVIYVIFYFTDTQVLPTNGQTSGQRRRRNAFVLYLVLFCLHNLSFLWEKYITCWVRGFEKG